MDLYKKQHICTKPRKNGLFLREPKQVNRPRQTDKPGKDRKNPKAQLSTSLMKVLRWNSVLIQMGAFKGQKYKFNHQVRTTVKLYSTGLRTDDSIHDFNVN